MSSEELKKLIIAIFVQFLGGLLAAIGYDFVKRQGFGIIAIGLVAIIVLALLVLYYFYIRRMQFAMYWFLAAVITLVLFHKTNLHYL